MLLLRAPTLLRTEHIPLVLCENSTTLYTYFSLSDVCAAVVLLSQLTLSSSGARTQAVLSEPLACDMEGHLKNVRAGFKCLCQEPLLTSDPQRSIWHSLAYHLQLGTYRKFQGQKRSKLTSCWTLRCSIWLFPGGSMYRYKPSEMAVKIPTIYST